MEYTLIINKSEEKNFVVLEFENKQQKPTLVIISTIKWYNSKKYNKSQVCVFALCIHVTKQQQQQKNTTMWIENTLSFSFSWLYAHHINIVCVALNLFIHILYSFWYYKFFNSNLRYYYYRVDFYFRIILREGKGAR